MSTPTGSHKAIPPLYRHNPANPGPIVTSDASRECGGSVPTSFDTLLSCFVTRGPTSLGPPSFESHIRGVADTRQRARRLDAGNTNVGGDSTGAPVRVQHLPIIAEGSQVATRTFPRG